MQHLSTYLSGWYLLLDAVASLSVAPHTLFYALHPFCLVALVAWPHTLECTPQFHPFCTQPSLCTLPTLPPPSPMCSYGAAGVDPEWLLPIVVDVGCETDAVRSDPLYVGLDQRRLRGEPYFALMEELVTALQVRAGSPRLIISRTMAMLNTLSAFPSPLPPPPTHPHGCATTRAAAPTLTAASTHRPHPTHRSATAPLSLCTGRTWRSVMQPNCCSGCAPCASPPTMMILSALPPSLWPLSWRRCASRA